MNALLRSTSFLAAILSLAAAVCMQLGAYSEPETLAAALLAILGTSLLWPVAPKIESTPSRPWLMLIAALALALVAMAPTRLAGALWFVGVLLVSTSSPKSSARAGASAAWLAGSMLLIGIALAPLWDRFEFFQPRLDPLAYAISGFLNVLGVTAVRAEDGLYVDMFWGTAHETLDLLRTGGLFLALVLILHGAVVFVAEGLRGVVRRTLPLAVVLFSFSVVRMAFLVIAVDRMSPDMTLFVKPVAILVSFVPVLLLASPLAKHLCPVLAFENSTPRRPWRAAGFAAGGLLLVCAGLAYYDRGAPREGVVLFDEAHSKWEKADVPFDRKNWGKESTYNYAGLVDLLGRHFRVRRNVEGELTPEKLADVQVVVIKTPTQPFSAREIKAVLDRVHDGAGLWLIGDHTNLHGMSDVLNRFALPAGLEFKHDSTFDMLTGGTTFHHDERLLHPISARCDTMAYQTSCTLIAHVLGVEPVLIGRRMTSEMADYGHPNFFGNIRSDVEDRMGTFLQGAAVSYGHGRVVAFTDSTILSNFALFDTGVSEMTLSTVAYLARSERMPRGWRETLVGIGLVFIALGIRGLRGVSFTAWSMCALASAYWTVTATSVFVNLSRGAVELPIASDPYRSICFVRDVSTFENTSFLQEAQGEADYQTNSRSISTFATWVSRLGRARPMFASSIADAVGRKPSVMVVFEPERAPSWQEMSDVFSFVQEGGTLLVIDDVRNARSSHSNDWTEPFGISPEIAEETQELFEARSDKHLELAALGGVLAPVEAVADIINLNRPRRGARIGTTTEPTKMVARGGTPFMTDGEGAVVGAYARRAHGFGALYTLGHGLTNRGLGGRYDPKPNEAKLACYDTAFELVQHALSFGERCGEMSR